MKHICNRYKQFIAMIVSFSLVITSIPPVRARGFLAVPACEEEILSQISEGLQKDNDQESSETLQADRKPLRAILAKEKNSIDDTDVKTAHEIANRIVLAISYEDTYKEKIAQCEQKDKKVLTDVLSVKGDVLIDVSSIVAERGGGYGELFYDALIIAYHRQARCMVSRFEMRQKYLKMEAYLRSARLFKPDNRFLKSELGSTLNCLRRYDEAKEMLQEFAHEREFKKARVNLGFTDLNQAQDLYRIFKGSLDEKQFKWAIEYMMDGLKIAQEGFEILRDITQGFEQGGDTDTRHIPRAYRGLAAIDMLRADFYEQLERAEKCKLRNVRNYKVKALSFMIKAIEYSVRALKIDSDNSNTRKIYADIIKKTSKMMQYFLRRPFNQGEQGMAEFSNHIKKLEEVLAPNRYKIPEKAKNNRYQLEQSIGDFHKRIAQYPAIKKKAITGIPAVVGQKLYEDIDEFYKAVGRYVVQNSDVSEEEVELEIPGIRYDAGYDLVDLLIIEGCLYYDPGDRWKENITDYVSTNMHKGAALLMKGVSGKEVSDEIAHRFNMNKYEVLGFYLKKKKKDDPEPKFKKDPHPYEKSHIQTAKRNDPGRVESIKQLFKTRVKPWLGSEVSDEYDAIIKQIEKEMKMFISSAEELLQSNKTKKQSEGDLESLKKKRVGKDGTGGYLAKVKRLDLKLKLRIDEIQKQIQEGSGVVKEYADAIEVLHKNYGFTFLLETFQDLEEIIRKLKHLCMADDKNYVSKARYDRLMRDAQRKHGEVVLFIKEHKAIFDEVNAIIISIEEIIKELKEKIDIDFKKDLEERCKVLKESYENITFSVGDITEQAQSVKKEAQEMLRRITKISILTIRWEDINFKICNYKSVFGEHRKIYLKTDEKYDEYSKREREIFILIRILENAVVGKINNYRVSYDNIDEFEEKIRVEEADVLTLLEDLYSKLTVFIVEKNDLIYKQIEYIENLLQYIFQWLEEDILPQYIGPGRCIVSHKKSIEDLQWWIQEFKEILKMDLNNPEIKDRSRNLKNSIEHSIEFGETVLKAIEAEMVDFKPKIENCARTFVRKNRIKKVSFREAESAGTIVWFNGFGLPVKIEPAIKDRDNGTLESITKAFMESSEFISLSLELNNVFKKWSNFKNQGIFPILEFFQSIYKLFGIYFMVYPDNYLFPIMDAHILLKQIYFLQFNKISRKLEEEKKKLTENRNDATRDKGWSLIKKIYYEVNPTAPTEEWPDDIEQTLYNYCDELNTEVLSYPVDFKDDDIQVPDNYQKILRNIRSSQ